MEAVRVVILIILAHGSKTMEFLVPKQRHLTAVYTVVPVIMAILNPVVFKVAEVVEELSAVVVVQSAKMEMDIQEPILYPDLAPPVEFVLSGQDQLEHSQQLV